ncbi:hypothetical protein I4I73_03690 [Pseudonocardia sp. KRD-184]|uniref:Uncharacterized protein n=1 Tax=Pseudonocardia oceani TaxID=2792013 RepID=A0ABS6U299_9PSEU|nr:hypothetical protein [Pseudonocardia oceani]MBW0088866.1 hypothetical protein [Pseudonocardia oceani]MBW0095100.1 hypothetical protein [Pseudonocardia oceani]MBW0107204.1 hypothetical protein [Pseudonocardia oceani]MBW0119700.1 hypothetical protein [Pseudonocardia oceani]MBW0126363.1 hypothetical protein [Pseudonocardia oceani]
MGTTARRTGIGRVGARGDLEQALGHPGRDRPDQGSTVETVRVNGPHARRVHHDVVDVPTRRPDALDVPEVAAPRDVRRSDVLLTRPQVQPGRRTGPVRWKVPIEEVAR